MHASWVGGMSPVTHRQTVVLVLLQHQLSSFLLLLTLNPPQHTDPTVAVLSTSMTSDFSYFSNNVQSLLASFCTAQSPLRLGLDHISCWICRRAEKKSSLFPNAKECHSAFVSFNSPTVSRIIAAYSELNFSVSTNTRSVFCRASSPVFGMVLCGRLKEALQGEARSVCCSSNKQKFGVKLQRSDIVFSKDLSKRVT